MIVSVLRDGCMNEALLPAYATPGSVGADIRVIETAEIYPGETRTFRTGLRVEIPENCGLFIFPRSGMGIKRKIRLANGTGVIDWDYRGEIMLPLHNYGEDLQLVEHGDRVAQGVLFPVIQAEFIMCESLSDTMRGEGGFGHTGTD
jgi:dUTP pyrophosphatase